MSANNDQWTIVTVSFNSVEHLVRCWAGGPPAATRWLVVDNDSSDDSVAVARSLGAQVIANPSNVGFSRANNQGLAVTETPYVMFVNPDVTVGTAEDFERLAGLATSHDALVAPQLLHPDGTEQHNARGLPHPWHKLAHRGLRLPGVDLGDYVRAGFTSPTYIAWAMGAAVGGSTAVWRELDGWDERYFIYYEDHDIGLRSWLAGHPVVLEPAVRWTHQWQRETSGMRLAPWRHELRSMTRFYGRNPALLSRRWTRSNKAYDSLAAKLWRPAQ